MLTKPLVLRIAVFLFFLGPITAANPLSAQEATGRWSVEKANSWHEETPWLVGANFTPAYAINQLEMFQADTFDVEAIDRELAWAEDLGFTSIRVYLHHLLWEQDAEGFVKRIDQLLTIAEKHDIGVMLVLFDSVWDPNPELGKQRKPQQGLHNSGWVQSPGAKDLRDRSRHGLLEDYVKGVVGAFKDDPRVQVWDVWNEPDNTNGNSYGENHLKQEPEDKLAFVLELLPQTFAWAREAGATQPLTAGVWLGGHKADPNRLNDIEKVQLEESDVISFHCYGGLKQLKTWVENLRPLNRPLICTEYMARPNGSEFDPILGYFADQQIGAYNWGFVAGKSNTIYPWDSWQKPYAEEPPVWFHDIFREDGTPYRQAEVDYIRSVTEAKTE
ncbi:glycoside hydrolase 5 family protein [Allorhodopirellula solitaria]|uniref:Sugar-binding cellulase-like protein n=1 Tax=Allorhodopirellula solitaria TaxID=2527987 RepID=A0A5C5YIU1_9BACT|nr:cellulase family glycosylhydrolase [Allorhodopirellula solitaria]TWT74780.1 Sugar-binding cellulase-like protein [Allorhodopirellula solitaria]